MTGSTGLARLAINFFPNLGRFIDQHHSRVLEIVILHGSGLYLRIGITTAAVLNLVLTPILFIGHGAIEHPSDTQYCNARQFYALTQHHSLPTL